MNAASAIVVCYLLGAVPFAVLAGRLKGVDVLGRGSRNPGATNAIRLLGPALGVPVLLLDIAKGLAAVTLVAPRVDGGGPAVALACGVAAVLGHVWPVWLKFRGGKGVATAAGAFLGISPGAIGFVVLAFCLALAATRYMSVASIAGAVTLPIALAALGADRLATGAGAAVAALVIVRHRGNLARIRSGTEGRVGRAAGKRAA